MNHFNKKDFPTYLHWKVDKANREFTPEQDWVGIIDAGLGLLMYKKAETNPGCCISYWPIMGFVPYHITGPTIHM